MNVPHEELAAGAPAAALERAPALFPWLRTLAWSIRRELWESRSIVLGPLAVSAVLLLGLLVSTVRLPDHVRELPTLAPAAQHARIVGPYSTAAGVPFVAAFLVGVFYCLDALYGERRDRSILFWKSIPVSDRTTVLSKAAVPLVVLPALVLPIIVVTQLTTLLVSSAVLLASGLDVAPLWDRLPLLQMWLATLYAMTIVPLWHAPLYAALLLVSAWARRAPFLWALLPLLAACAFEAFAFRTWSFARFLGHRVSGWYFLGFDPFAPGAAPDQPLEHVTAARLLAAPDLWLGLLFAAACLAGAVRLRRRRGPL